MKKTQIQLSDHFTYQKLLRFVLPSIVMMVFTSIYGVVDGLFVSNFAGKTPFAAINLVMPFIMVLGGIGFMIGTGGTALVSKVLGEGEPEKAKRYFTIGFGKYLPFFYHFSFNRRFFLGRSPDNPRKRGHSRSLRAVPQRRGGAWGRADVRNSSARRGSGR